jgi:hypothetical protein
MRKSYRKLDDDQRSVLVAMLDSERSPEVEKLDTARRRFQNPMRPIQEEIDLLKEGFLQESTSIANQVWSGSSSGAVDWIHPSYRDLVIEELERDAIASEQFLQHCSWVGLRLTLSVAGGDRGQRRYPLMTTDMSWTILQKRLIVLLEETTANYQIYEILQTVRGSLTGTSGMEELRRRIAQIIKACCDTLRARLDQQQIELNSSILKEYFDMTMAIVPPPPMPNLYTLWRDLQSAFESALENADATLLDEEALSKWIAVIQIVLKADRRLLIQDGFPDRYDELIETLCNAVTVEADTSVTFPDDDTASSESDRFSSISNDLDELIPYFSHLEDKLQRASSDAYTRSRSIRESVRSSSESNQPNWSSQRSVTATPVVDLERLFSDL